jgi:hypothetical protein
MRTFDDLEGRSWTAEVREERTPRHHGRWYLCFTPGDGSGPTLPMPEVRWQTRQTGERTLRTMAEFELRRRLDNVLGRFSVRQGPPPPAV